MDTTPVNNALDGLDGVIIELICSMLEEFSYKKMKEQLINRISVSETTKFNHLLTDNAL